MLRRVVSLLVVSLACLPALGQNVINVIYQWNGYYEDPNNCDPNDPCYTVFQGREITIHRAVGGQVFEFEAVQWTGDPADPNTWEYVGPGDINLIQADPNAGAVTITVVADPNGPNGQHNQPFGAANVKQITLNQTGVTGVIQSLKLSQNLAEIGAVYAADISGDCLIGDPENPETGHVLHPVVLDCATGTLQCNGLDDFSVGAEVQIDASIEGHCVTSALRTCRVRAADATGDRQRGRTVRPAEMVAV